MNADWVNALDWCAASGAIDYDAPAFILGESPRYVGHPVMEQMPLHNDFLLPKGTTLKSLDSDTYGNSDGELVHNPTWKKVLFGSVIAGGIALAAGALGRKGIIKLPKFLANIKTPNFSGTNNLFGKIWSGIKKPFSFIASKFKKAKP